VAVPRLDPRSETTGGARSGIDLSDRTSARRVVGEAPRDLRRAPSGVARRRPGANDDGDPLSNV